MVYPKDYNEDMDYLDASERLRRNSGIRKVYKSTTESKESCAGPEGEDTFFPHTKKNAKKNRRSWTPSDKTDP